MGAFTLPKYRKRSIINILGRLCQLIGAIAVCVYYGRILHEAMRKDVYGDARWILATTTGALSGLTALVYIVFTLLLNEFRATALLFAWDTCLTILWIVTAGIFGSMYLSENPEMDEGIKDMIVAAGFDLTNMFLWMVSSGYCGWVVFVADRRVLMEGREKRVEGEGIALEGGHGGGHGQGVHMQEQRRSKSHR